MTEQPNNKEAEEALIACCFLDPEVVSEAQQSGITSDSFFTESHRLIFAAIEDMEAEGAEIEEITLMDRLRKTGDDKQVGGLNGLMAIQNRVETAGHARYFATIVKEKAALRQMLRLCRETTEACNDQTGELPELLDRLETKAREIGEQTGREVEILGSKELIDQWMEAFKERVANPESAGARVRTNLEDLNRILPSHGLLPGQVVIIGARPSLGKTSLAMNWAEQVAVDDGVPVFVFSMEMTAQELVGRMACSRAHVDSKSVDDGYVEPGDQGKLHDATQEIREAPLYIDGKAENTIATIRAKSRNLANRLERKGTPLGMIVIDYLQLVEGLDKKARREEQITQMSRGCKLLAKELGVPVVVLCQLNREMEREGRAPRLSDLRQSGSIEQDSDIVLLLQRKGEDADAPDTKEIETIKILHAKVRNGPVGDFLTTFQKTYTRFENYGGSEQPF